MCRNSWLCFFVMLLLLLPFNLQPVEEFSCFDPSTPVILSEYREFTKTLPLHYTLMLSWLSVDVECDLYNYRKQIFIDETDTKRSEK